MGLFDFISKKTTIVCPVEGEVLPITSSSDKVFSEKMMGDGFLVKPIKGEFFSPVSGRVSMIFDTKHAIAFTTDKFDILVHIGMDTVRLDGKGYEILVEVGEKVKIGQKIANVDVDFINRSGFSTETPVVITNLDGKEIQLLKTGKCDVSDELIIL